ncbi:predicted N-acetyltransferase YhbS [Ureibacillus xyleni]|uniref:Predicted N-acetyltransferase YhbS n=1 Tax=Ureibacillus xyleni TaxID=614648 RepID=A0A285TPB4_9BACL|nr:N-acetyltransferase [Ureibacillus xyleni]SOC24615.1 predicted N-acetyltransferase YhbS [Ureibacillus xyleni]
MNLKIRQEQVDDYDLTEMIVKNAFANAEHSDQKEHLLVSRIRKSKGFIPKLSLVATNEDNNEILGHILLSKVKISKGDNEWIESLSLAPVSVLPEYQNKGIGGLLITEALKEAKELGYHSVVVLGHPEYYPKFGFKKASLWGIKAPFEVPDETFMAKELSENALNNASGVVEYPSVFFE